MQNSEEAIREWTLRAIADDYEDFDRICHDVTRWAEEYGLIPDPRAILKALATLINEGSAQAYVLSEDPAARTTAMPFSEGCVNELWFYVTPKGKQLAVAFHKKWSRDKDEQSSNG